MSEELGTERTVRMIVIRPNRVALRVSVKSDGGTERIALRTYFYASGRQEWTPSKFGVEIPPDAARAVVEAIEEAQRNGEKP